MINSILAIICGILLIISFVGVFVPAIPDIPLAWAGLIIYAWGTGFSEITITSAIVITVITIVLSIIDIVIQLIGAKKLNASKAGFVGILTGLVVGLFFGPFGTIICPVLGAFAGEYVINKNIKQALKSAAGSIIGFLCGSVIKAIFIIVLAFYFIIILV